MDNEGMVSRVRKLFAKADSTTSEHERDALLTKAYDLLAKHGIEEALARGEDHDADTVTVWEFKPKGSYKLDQIMLIGVIAKALHCTAVRRGQEAALVYGVRRHLDRVEMLGGFLVAYMIGNLATLKAPHGIHATTYRKSAMAAFINTVGKRLRESEDRAKEESSDSAGAGIVLLSDARKAAQAMNQANPRLAPSTRRRVSTAGFSEGTKHGDRVDLGGSKLGASRLSLEA